MLLTKKVGDVLTYAKHKKRERMRLPKTTKLGTLRFACFVLSDA